MQHDNLFFKVHKIIIIFLLVGEIIELSKIKRIKNKIWTNIYFESVCAYCEITKVNLWPNNWYKIMVLKTLRE